MVSCKGEDVASEIEACRQCRQRIKSRLEAPATADFDDCNRAIIDWAGSRNDFTVYSHVVDAGKRKTFKCKVKYKGNNQWDVQVLYLKSEE